MKLLRTAALTGIVIAAVVVLALEPASGASTDKNVAGCDGAMNVHPNPSWRAAAGEAAAGPVGMERSLLRRMQPGEDGGQVVGSLLVEGQEPVTVKVPAALREEVYLYFGPGEGGKKISFSESNGFSEVEFRPCEDRRQTIWPGGVRVHGAHSVHLVVEAEGKTAVLKLGRPQRFAK
jgi:hypothetical protein